MALFTTVRSSPLAAPAAAAPSLRRTAPRFLGGRSSSHAAVLLSVSCSKGRRASLFSRALSVRCEQSTKQEGGGGGGGGSVVDVWAGRLAMVSFAAAVVAEVSTGKGLVENFGVPTPAPALALVVTALVAGLAILFIVRSGSQD